MNSTFWWLQSIHVLYAKIRRSQFFSDFFMSFLFDKNSIRPNIDPWGTPQFKIPISESVFLRLTTTFCLFKLEPNQSIVFGVKPKYFILFRSILWSRGSNAFISQLISFQLIYQTQNLLRSGWTNEQDKCLLKMLKTRLTFIKYITFF